MTMLQLFSWIAAGLLLQIALFSGIGFWRYRQNYLSLQKQQGDSKGFTLPSVAIEEASAPKAAWKGLRTFRVERKVLEDAAEQVCSFYLVPEDGQALPPFLPGQFLTFQLAIGGPAQDKKPVTRCYSLSDSPNGRHYRISVKRLASPQTGLVPPGVASNYFHEQVGVGTVLPVMPPAGQFYIDAGNTPAVLIAGGIGVTPMLSMLAWVLSHQPNREIWLFYGARNAAELVLQSQWLELARNHPSFHLHLCLSDPHAFEPEEIRLPYVHLHHVRADIQLLRRILPLKSYAFYICGPSAMLQSLVPALEEWGVPQERIHFEAFGPASVSRAKKAPADSLGPQASPPLDSVQVNFSRSNKQVQWSPGMGSLLELAEGQGIDVNSNCRSGVCGTCQTQLSQGQVTYTADAIFDIQAGSCLLCIATPATDISLEI